MNGTISLFLVYGINLHSMFSSRTTHLTSHGSRLNSLYRWDFSTPEIRLHIHFSSMSSGTRLRRIHRLDKNSRVLIFDYHLMPVIHVFLSKAWWYKMSESFPPSFVILLGNFLDPTFDFARSNIISLADPVLHTGYTNVYIHSGKINRPMIHVLFKIMLCYIWLQVIIGLVISGTPDPK